MEETRAPCEGDSYSPAVNKVYRQGVVGDSNGLCPSFSNVNR